MITEHISNSTAEITKYTVRLTSEMSRFREVHNELVDINKTLHEILHGNLRVDNTDVEFKLKKKITDDGFIDELQKILSVYNFEKKLIALTIVAEDLKEYAASLVSKREKLRSMIKLSPNSPETRAAMAALKVVNNNLSIVGARFTFVISTFFKYRKAMLNYIMGNTEKLLAEVSDAEGRVSDEFRNFFQNAIKKENFHDEHNAMVSKLKRRA
jgi:hypothetical protein